MCAWCRSERGGHNVYHRLSVHSCGAGTFENCEHPRRDSRQVAQAMKVEHIVCDECGITKGESNHWMQMDAIEAIGPYNARVEINKMGSRIAGLTDVCGQNCASILLARWMATGKLDKPSVEG